MTSPVEKQQQSRHAAAIQRRGWCCNTLITEPHIPGCAFEPREDDAVAELMRGGVTPEHDTEPPAADSPVESAPAASLVPEDKPYGFSRPKEFDFWTPNGDKVRLRKLRRTQVLKMNLQDLVDSFSPELLKGIGGDDPAIAADAESHALQALNQTAPIFDAVLVAACVCPQFSGLNDPDLETVEIEDKIAIFNEVMPEEMAQAAVEAQQEAFKSLRTEQAAVVRNLRDGEAVRPETE